MTTIRDRTKDHLPTVVLTLLSIIQALALELLWGHIVDTDYDSLSGIQLLIVWLQNAATFFGVVLIWLAYAGSAMRLRWVPTISDSVYPFVVGIMEFAIIRALVPGSFSYWLMGIAVLFGLMVWIDHSIMRRARRDGENDIFFREFQPAKFRDFLPSIVTFIAVMLAGVYFRFSDDSGYAAVVATIGVIVMLSWFFYNFCRYWQRSVHDSNC